MNHCPNCGKQIEAGAAYCSNCGQKLPQEEKKTIRTRREIKPKVAIIIILIFIAAVVGLILGVSSISGQPREEAYTPFNSTSSTPMPTLAPGQTGIAVTAYLVTSNATGLELTWNLPSYISSPVGTEFDIQAHVISHSNYTETFSLYRSWRTADGSQLQPSELVYIPVNGQLQSRVEIPAKSISTILQEDGLYVPDMVEVFGPKVSGKEIVFTWYICETDDDGHIMYIYDEVETTFAPQW